MPRNFRPCFTRLYDEQKHNIKHKMDSIFNLTYITTNKAFSLQGEHSICFVSIDYIDVSVC